METFQANQMAARTERLRTQLTMATTKELLEAAQDLDTVAQSEDARDMVDTMKAGWVMLDSEEESEMAVRTIRTQLLQGLARVNVKGSEVAAVIREMRTPTVCGSR